MMADENLIYLIKGFPILVMEPSADDWYDIPIDHVHRTLTHISQPNYNGESDLFDALLNFINKQKAENPDYRLLRLSCVIADHRILSDIIIPRSLVERLCEILPKPFLQVLCKMRDPFGTADGITIEKRLDLTDMVQRPGLKRLLRGNDPLNHCITYDILIGWEASSESTMKMNGVSLAHNLFARESSKDLVIVAGNGAEVKCHRIIFEAHSEVLAAMVSHGNGMKESISGRVELTENSEEGISHLIRYMYGMELKSKDIPCDLGVELFKTAHKYKLAELQDYIGKVLLKKQRDWFVPNDLLELYFHVKNVTDFRKLSEHLLTIMASLNLEIRECERFAEIKETDPNEAMELVWKLFDMVKEK